VLMSANQASRLQLPSLMISAASIFGICSKVFVAVEVAVVYDEPSPLFHCAWTGAAVATKDFE